MAPKVAAATIAAAPVSTVKRATKKAKASWSTRPQEPRMPEVLQPDVKCPQFAARELSNPWHLGENAVQATLDNMIVAAQESLKSTRKHTFKTSTGLSITIRIPKPQRTEVNTAEEAPGTEDEDSGSEEVNPWGDMTEEEDTA